MCGGSQKSPPPVIPPVLPEAPDASKRAPVSKDTSDDQRRRAGQAGTILSGSRGLQPDTANVDNVRLLGN